ncbi:hypothetical protein C0991_004337 [Blastosporella zonata]|nr:hypothetical protein C0991_004337 [Blastosporella zonata]
MSSQINLSNPYTLVATRQSGPVFAVPSTLVEPCKHILEFQYHTVLPRGSDTQRTFPVLIWIPRSGTPSCLKPGTQDFESMVCLRAYCAGVRPYGETVLAAPPLTKRIKYVQPTFDLTPECILPSFQTIEDLAAHGSSVDATDFEESVDARTSTDLPNTDGGAWQTWNPLNLDEADEEPLPLAQSFECVLSSCTTRHGRADFSASLSQTPWPSPRSRESSSTKSVEVPTVVVVDLSQPPVTPSLTSSLGTSSTTPSSLPSLSPFSSASASTAPSTPSPSPCQPPTPSGCPPPSLSPSAFPDVSPSPFALSFSSTPLPQLFPPSPSSPSPAFTQAFNTARRLRWEAYDAKSRALRAEANALDAEKRVVFWGGLGWRDEGPRAGVVEGAVGSMDVYAREEPLDCEKKNDEVDDIYTEEEEAKEDQVKHVASEGENDKVDDETEKNKEARSIPACALGPSPPPPPPPQLPQHQWVHGAPQPPPPPSRPNGKMVTTPELKRALGALRSVHPPLEPFSGSVTEVAQEDEQIPSPPPPPPFLPQSSVKKAQTSSPSSWRPIISALELMRVRSTLRAVDPLPNLTAPPSPPPRPATPPPPPASNTRARVASKTPRQSSRRSGKIPSTPELQRTVQSLAQELVSAEVPPPPPAPAPAPRRPASLPTSTPQRRKFTTTPELIRTRGSLTPVTTTSGPNKENNGGNRFSIPLRPTNRLRDGVWKPNSGGGTSAESVSVGALRVPMGAKEVNGKGGLRLLMPGALVGLMHARKKD